jgi:DNA-binding CsgD family transcriptional regulator
MPYIIRYIDDGGQILTENEILIPRTNYCVEIFGIWPESITFVQKGQDIVVNNQGTMLVRLCEAMTLFEKEVTNFSVLVATGKAQRRFNIPAILRFLSQADAMDKIIMPKVALEPLTPRETECITWLAHGLKTSLISYLLEITDSTVNMHITSAKQKLKAATREEAVGKAVKLGLVNIEL